MKRIHLFEFEDFSWFPNWIRILMTRFMIAMHKLVNSSEELAELLNRVLQESGQKQIIDLCSGSGGPMPEVIEILKSKYGHADLNLLLSDLYPNTDAAQHFNNSYSNIQYSLEPIDATSNDSLQAGLRTLICSMHHMKPVAVRNILQSAMAAQQPFCALEISDNSFPKLIWWMAFPINIITTLFVTPLVRPMTWQQLVFTYLIPILPLLIAWDGAVSNARTYTLADLEIILADLKDANYHWEKGIIKGKSKKIYLLGLPN